jgi:hypothetical protein
MKHAGNCLCGAVQYESSADPLDVGYCHCKMCQKLSGSTVLPWASFLLENFAYTRGAPKVYRSSSHGRREFCGDCGSQIAFRSANRPKTVEINVGTLNEPGKFKPQYHIWCDSRIAWFEIADSLPRHAKAGPTGSDT